MTTRPRIVADRGTWAVTSAGRPYRRRKNVTVVSLLLLVLSLALGQIGRAHV